MIQESDKDELILKVLDGIATPEFRLWLDGWKRIRRTRFILIN